jgi:hypothetical protein
MLAPFSILSVLKQEQETNQMSRFTLFIRHDVVEYNGQEASSFFIVAQDINSGRRIALNTSYETTHELHEQQAVREKQNRRIMAIEKHLDAGGTLNSEHWQEIEPAYGSPAYQVAQEAGLI